MNALLQAFAALGSVVGVISACAAFLAFVVGNDPDEIGGAAGVGLAIGFAPGVVAAVYVYQQIASQSAIRFIGQ